MLPAIRSVPPGGANEWESATAWTGDKRRKTSRTSPPGSSDDDADMMDIQLQEGQGGKGGGQHHPPEDDSGIPVYSVNDEISDEELHLCLGKVKSRTPTIFVRFASRIVSEKEQEELYERFCQLRLKNCSKMIKPEDTNAPTGSNCAHEFDWNHSCGPDRIYDWTIDNEYFDLAELSDYQRIIPTREDIYEYRDWEEYRLTFSNYETDEDYVKYCDELSKKIKWIEEYQHLDDVEFSKLKRRAYRQAMKIAAEFSHLPASLAARGFEEHIYYIERNKGFKDLDNIHFETWKRVTKQKMSFRAALEEILATNMFPSHCQLIESEIRGDTRYLSIQFEICMKHIPENVEVNDELLERFTHVIFKELKPKTYACYVRKKLEIGRRLQLTPPSHPVYLTSRAVKM